MTIPEILEDYPELQEIHIRDALAFKKGARHCYATPGDAPAYFCPDWVFMRGRVGLWHNKWPMFCFQA
jgi:hypothetical protein